MEPEVSSFLTTWIYPIAYAAIIIVVGFWASRFAGKIAVRSSRNAKLSEALARFLGQAARYTVIALAVITAAAKVGLETTSLVALLGSAGLAVGLALQGTLSHFASGLMLLIFRPFDIDDKITAGGQTGVVEEIGLFATTLSTLGNDTIIIPNGAIASGTITNHTRKGTIRGAVNVGVAYGSDVDEVRTLLTKAAQSVDGVLEAPGASAVFVDLGASSLDFTVFFFTKPADYGPTLGGVRKAVYDALNEAGIDIPYQTVVVQQASDS